MFRPFKQKKHKKRKERFIKGKRESERREREIANRQRDIRPQVFDMKTGESTPCAAPIGTRPIPPLHRLPGESMRHEYAPSKRDLGKAPKTKQHRHY